MISLKILRRIGMSCLSQLILIYFLLIAPFVPQAANMNSVLESVHSLMQMFDGKAHEFVSEIDNVHMVWLEEIQQEANRMFSR